MLQSASAFISRAARTAVQAAVSSATRASSSAACSTSHNTLQSGASYVSSHASSAAVHQVDQLLFCRPQTISRVGLPCGSMASISCQQPHFSQQQLRGMAVGVDVEDGNVHAAMGKLNRRVREAGIIEESRKRQFHMNKSEQRFKQEIASYNRAMAKIINERLRWAVKRGRVKITSK